MIKVISNPKSRYSYVAQVPDDSEERKLLPVFCLHGSMDDDESTNLNWIKQEYFNGRYKFALDVMSSSIFITPVITRKFHNLSNGLEVDPQRFTRGCIHELCKKEFPNEYAPHLEIKKIIDNLKEDLKINVKDRVIFTGISAGGSLATALGFIYPEITESVLSFLNEEIIIPVDGYEDLKLIYPFGTYGIGECPDINIQSKKIESYLRIPKLILVDRKDNHNEPKESSLYSAISERFFNDYTKKFGANIYERAYNVTNYLNSQFGDNIELVVTPSNGHRISNEDYDAHMERYIRSALRK